MGPRKKHEHDSSAMKKEQADGNLVAVALPDIRVCYSFVKRYWPGP